MFSGQPDLIFIFKIARRDFHEESDENVEEGYIAMMDTFCAVKLLARKHTVVIPFHKRDLSAMGFAWLKGLSLKRLPAVCFSASKIKVAFCTRCCIFEAEENNKLTK